MYDRIRFMVIDGVLVVGPAMVDAQAAGPREVLRAAVSVQLEENALPSEAEMQASVIAWADSQEHPALRWLFHPANGEYRTPATAARLKTMGVRPGIVDLWLPYQRAPWCGLAIELKRKPNRTTAAQEECLHWLGVNGWLTMVAYSAEDAIRGISEYLDIAADS